LIWINTFPLGRHVLFGGGGVILGYSHPAFEYIRYFICTATQQPPQEYNFSKHHFHKGAINWGGKKNLDVCTQFFGVRLYKI